jgi:alkylation response protein AidB-like acyl-CoA dehydrogenase
MELTDTQRDLQAFAHEFAEKEMGPVSAHYDETEQFPWPVVRKAAELGLTCYDLPEAYGGFGIHDLLTSVLLTEELAWGDSAIAGCISGGQFFAGPIVALAATSKSRGSCRHRVRPATRSSARSRPPSRRLVRTPRR